MLLLTASDINRLTDICQLIDDIHDALLTSDPGPVPPLAVQAERGSFAACPARAGDAVGLCWTGQFGPPDVQGVLLVNDQHTGCPLALLDGGSVSRLRTAAMMAVATRALARIDAQSIGVMGCDPAAVQIVDALRTVRPISEVRLYDLECRRATVLAALLGYPARQAHPADAMAADIVVARPGPHELNWDLLHPGTHVNLGPEPGQESPHGLGKQATTFSDLDGSLRSALGGRTPARKHDREITVFCGHASATAAVTTAMSLYRQALRRGIGTPVQLR